MVKCVCKLCGKEFFVSPYYSKNGRGQYCSRKCSQNRPHKFSIERLMELWNEGKSVHAISVIMKISEVTISNFLKKKGIYEIRRPIAEKCYNYKNGLKTNTRRYRIQKNECEVCNYDKVPEILQIHHRDRNRENNSFSNLIVLCPNCHYETHFKEHTGLFSLHRKRYTINNYRGSLHHSWKGGFNRKEYMKEYNKKYWKKYHRNGNYYKKLRAKNETL